MPVLNLSANQVKGQNWWAAWQDSWGGASYYIGSMGGVINSHGVGCHFTLGATILKGSTINPSTFTCTPGRSKTISLKIKAELAAAPATIANDAAYQSRRGLAAGHTVVDIGLVTSVFLDLPGEVWTNGTPMVYDITAMLQELVNVYPITTLELWVGDHDNLSSEYSFITSYNVSIDYTLPPLPVIPVVTSGVATAVGNDSVVLHGTTVTLNDTEITEEGWVFSNVSHPANPGDVAPSASGYSNWVTILGHFGLGAFNGGLSALTPSTTYFFRAVVKNDNGAGHYAYGAELSFTTLTCIPVATTQAQTLVTKTTATLNGTAITLNDTELTEEGFVFDTISHALPGDVSPGTSGYTHHQETTGHFGLGAFLENLAGLLPGTRYYFRSYVKNDFGTGHYAYGAELSFTTLTCIPVVATSSHSLVTKVSATLHGSVTTINDTNIIEEGFVYGLVSQALPGDIAPGASGYSSFASNLGAFGLGAFSKAVTSLLPGKVYYFRAFVKNDYGLGHYAYGAELELTTGIVLVCGVTGESGYFAISSAGVSRAVSFATCRASATGSFIKPFGILYAGGWTDGFADPTRFEMQRGLLWIGTSAIPPAATILKAVLHGLGLGLNLGPWFFVPGETVLVRAPLGPTPGTTGPTDFGYLGTCNDEVGHKLIDWETVPQDFDIVLDPAFILDIQKGTGALTLLGFRQRYDMDNAQPPDPGNSALGFYLGAGPQTWLEVTYLLPEGLPKSQMSRVPRVQSIVSSC